MFHHLEAYDRQRTLREVVRILKPGGSFHLFDFAGGDKISHGHLPQWFHASERLKDNSNERITEMLHQAGFVRAQKTRDGSMLFGLLPTSYYEGIT